MSMYRAAPSAWPTFRRFAFCASGPAEPDQGFVGKWPRPARPAGNRAARPSTGSAVESQVRVRVSMQSQRHRWELATFELANAPLASDVTICTCGMCGVFTTTLVLARGRRFGCQTLILPSKLDHSRV
jgi:hypothetical protein